MPLPAATAADCPFCSIAKAYTPAYPPIPAADAASEESSLEARPAHLLLSTPLVLAFLDIAPISRGHVLIATRQHRAKLSEVSVEEGQAIGAWLGVLSRAVIKAVDPQHAQTHATGSNIGDWNVVQNNGARAAQTVPHVHFHIIPRGSDIPDARATSWTIFGRGQREDLDEEDAAVLLPLIRRNIHTELAALSQREGEAVVAQLLGNKDLSFLKAKL